MFAVLSFTLFAACTAGQHIINDSCECPAAMFLKYRYICSDCPTSNFKCNGKEARCTYQLQNAAGVGLAFENGTPRFMSAAFVDEQVEHYVCPAQTQLFGLLKCAAGSLSRGIFPAFFSLKCERCPAGRTCVDGKTEAGCKPNFVCPDLLPVDQLPPATHCTPGFFMKLDAHTQMFSDCVACADASQCSGTDTEDPELMKSGAKCAKSYVLMKDNRFFCTNSVNGTAASDGDKLTDDKKCDLAALKAVEVGADVFCHTPCQNGQLEYKFDPLNGKPICGCPVGFWQKTDGCTQYTKDHVSFSQVMPCGDSSPAQKSYASPISNLVLIFCVTDPSAGEPPHVAAPVPPMRPCQLCDTSDAGVVIGSPGVYYCVKRCAKLVEGSVMVGTKSALAVCRCEEGTSNKTDPAKCAADAARVCAAGYVIVKSGAAFCLEGLAATEETAAAAPAAPVSQIIDTPGQENNLKENELCDVKTGQIVRKSGKFYCVKSCGLPKLQAGAKDDVPVCKCPAATFGADCAASGAAADKNGCKAGHISRVVQGKVVCADPADIDSPPANQAPAIISAAAELLAGKSCDLTSGRIAIGPSKTYCVTQANYCKEENNFNCSGEQVLCKTGFSLLIADTYLVCVPPCSPGQDFSETSPPCSCGEGFVLAGGKCEVCPNAAISCPGNKEISKCKLGYKLSADKRACVSCVGSTKYCDGTDEVDPSSNINFKRVEKFVDGFPICAGMYKLNVNLNVNPAICVQGPSCGQNPVSIITNCFCSGYFVMAANYQQKTCLLCPNGAKCADYVVKCDIQSLFLYTELSTGLKTCRSCAGTGGTCANQKLSCSTLKPLLNFFGDQCISCPAHAICANNVITSCDSGYMINYLTQQDCICESSKKLLDSVCVDSAANVADAKNRPLLHVYQQEGKLTMVGTGFKHEAVPLVRALINFTTVAAGSFNMKTTSFDFGDSFTATISGPQTGNLKVNESTNGDNKAATLDEFSVEVSRGLVSGALLTIKKYDDTVVGVYRPIIQQLSDRNRIELLSLSSDEIRLSLFTDQNLGEKQYQIQLITEQGYLQMTSGVVKAGDIVFNTASLDTTASNQAVISSLHLSIANNLFYLKFNNSLHTFCFGQVKQKDTPKLAKKQASANFVGVVIGIIIAIAAVIGIGFLVHYLVQRKKIVPKVYKIKNIEKMNK